MAGPLVADTGGLLRAIARKPSGRPTWPEFERALRTASRVIVPALFPPRWTVARAVALDRKFHALEIGLVDGIVAAVAERLRGIERLRGDCWR